MRITRLDGIRGAAALIVMLFHYFPAAPWGLFGHGYLAVDLFFMLSGFVIALNYDARLLGGMSLSEFVKARAIRLYPLAIAAVLSVLVLRLAYPQPTISSGDLLGRAVVNAALLPNFALSAAERFPLVAPTWSLFFELAVNVGYAAAIGWLVTGRLSVAVALVGAVLAALAWSVGSVEFLHQSIAAGMVRTGFSFGLGAWLFRNLDLVTRLRPHAPAWLAYPILLAPLMLPLSGSPWLLDLVYIALIAPVGMTIALAPNDGRSVQEAEKLAGELSYPLYLLHMPVALYTSIGLGWLFTGAQLSLIAVPVSLIAAYLAWRLYDVPARGLINDWRRARRGGVGHHPAVATDTRTE